MRTLFYLLSIVLLNSAISIQGYAQEENEEIVIKEGDLAFLKSKVVRGLTAMRRAGSEKLTPESYIGATMRTSNSDDLTIEKEFFQEIFTQERIKELSGGRLICDIFYSGIEQKVMYVEFTWVPFRREGESDFPVTLQELDLLENRLKSYPFIFKNTGTVKQDQFSILTNPIVFSRLIKE